MVFGICDTTYGIPSAQGGTPEGGAAHHGQRHLWVGTFPYCLYPSRKSIADVITVPTLGLWCLHALPLVGGPRQWERAKIEAAQRLLAGGMPIKDVVATLEVGISTLYRYGLAGPAALPPVGLKATPT
jgi:hypothetical protein